MKITIDTKEDTHHEIRKVLGLLTDLLNKEQADPRRRSFAEPQESTPDSASMMSMFDQEETKSVPDTAPDFTSFLNLANRKEKKEEWKEPKIEFF